MFKLYAVHQLTATIQGPWVVRGQKESTDRQENKLNTAQSGLQEDSQCTPTTDKYHKVPGSIVQ